jgi:hypothetical protein
MMAALSFPLSRENFMNLLKVRSVTFRDFHAIEASQLADGTIIKASLGATLWSGVIQLAPARNEDAAAIESLLSILQRPGASFFVYDPRRIGPRNDPAGTTIGSASPVIASVNADNRQLALNGLPAGYVLSRGDMLSFSYLASPTRYALHRVVETVTANGSGSTGQFEVTPLIRTGATVGAAVTLVRPFCKAVLRPSPDYGSSVPLITDGASFEFVQTLR